ncbi:DUF4402 domain-containing protein [Shewanella nanhaiensis]|uniref:DUF4402 domain-containing protein n=1 Tax=Shewanella nanhaiensis TaxID=2864872 RepID=A0ABS7E728_9GAMM|nr:DUF4402 domain-containing protein [Shewanella nanhaiensis]MBW8184812.1 DUF4402 domain-containing protein [Shewanella nanhaiensis]
MLSTVLFVSLVGQVGFNLIDPLEITETKSVHFGDILNQANASCRMTVGSRTGDACIQSPSTLGMFRINSGGSADVQIRVYSVGSQDIDFTPLLENETSEQNYQLAKDEFEFNVGGELMIKRVMEAGQHQITYMVEVNYF